MHRMLISTYAEDRKEDQQTCISIIVWTVDVKWLDELSRNSADVKTILSSKIHLFYPSQYPQQS